jgi:Arc/MetJ-type ribon-helix-helix transcriptional regulator
MQLKLQKPELEEYLTEQVRRGNFPTPEAVVEDALRRVMREELTDEDVAAIEESARQLDRGEGIDSRKVAARMRKMYDSAKS